MAGRPAIYELFNTQDGTRIFDLSQSLNTEIEAQDKNKKSLKEPLDYRDKPSVLSAFVFPQDAFGDEAIADVKYKTLTWWYVQNISFSPCNACS